MTFRNDETIQCVRCGRPFIWSFGEQRYYREHNLHRPKRCPQCREIVKAERRSSEFDHPIPSLPPQSVPKPAPKPLFRKRPSWWANPHNQNDVVLGLLVILFVVTLIILLVVAI